MLRVTQLSGEEVTSIPLAELSDVRALKQRLHRQHGLPPRFRQRLLQEGNTVDDAMKLDAPIDLQVVAMAFSDPSDEQKSELCHAIDENSVDKALGGGGSCSLLAPIFGKLTLCIVL